jgi:hypothetical protein
MNGRPHFISPYTQVLRSHRAGTSQQNVALPIPLPTLYLLYEYRSHLDFRTTCEHPYPVYEHWIIINPSSLKQPMNSAEDTLQDMFMRDRLRQNIDIIPCAALFKSKGDNNNLKKALKKVVALITVSPAYCFFYDHTLNHW